jgi:viroplasmin and RNaseH domain-containing protein
MLIVKIIVGINRLHVAIAYARKNREVNAMGMRLSEAETHLALADEKVEERDNHTQKRREQFEQLSAKELRDNNEPFLLLAKNSFNTLTDEANSEFGNAVKSIQRT